MDSEFQQLQKMASQPGGLNPVQQSRYSLLQSQGGGQTSGQGYSFNNIPNPLDTARNIVQFNQQANQPAIQNFQGQTDPLKQRYQDIIDSIRGQQQAAENQVTTTAANELGQRGVLPSSTLGQQQIHQSILPVQSQFSGQIAQAKLSENQDINTINNAIAQLQTGNPEAALQAAQGIYQGQISQAGLGLQQQQQQFNQRYITIPGIGIYDIQNNKLVGGMSTNNLSSGGYSITGVR